MVRARRGMTVARPSTSGTERRSANRDELRWKIVTVVLVGVAVGSLALASSKPNLIAPQVGLIIMAVVAGFFTSVTTTRAGTTLVINPAVSFSFAALLSYGLAPAILAQLTSVVVVYWRTGRSLLDGAGKAVQFSASLLAAAGVIGLAGFGPHTSIGSWASLTSALVVLGAIVAWLVTYVGVGLLLGLANRGPPVFRVLVKDHLGFLLLSKAALLALAPLLAFAAEVNVAFLPLVLVPLAAVQQMA